MSLVDVLAHGKHEAPTDNFDDEIKAAQAGKAEVENHHAGEGRVTRERDFYGWLFDPFASILDRLKEN